MLSKIRFLSQKKYALLESRKDLFSYFFLIKMILHKILRTYHVYQFYMKLLKTKLSTIGLIVN